MVTCSAEKRLYEIFLIAWSGEFFLSGTMTIQTGTVENVMWPLCQEGTLNSLMNRGNSPVPLLTSLKQAS